MKKFIINFRYAFNIRKPIAMLRIALNLFMVHFLKETPLRYIDIKIGDKCNLSCRHCFVADGKQKIHIIGDYLRNKIVRQCMDLGAVNFSITGGEPLLYGDELFRLIKIMSPKENIISISTNGTLLTEEMAKKLKSAGVDILTLSIDTYRDIPFEKYIETVDIATKAGLKITIGYTISHDTFLDPLFTRVLLEFAIRRKIIVMIIYAVPCGKLAGKNVELNSREILAIKRITDRFEYVRTDHQTNYKFTGCGGGTEILYITDTGNVQFCAYVDKFFGNVWNDDIANIRKRILRDPVLNAHRDICIAAQKINPNQ